MKPNSVKPLHLLINNSKEYNSKSNTNKYLTLVPTDESKHKLKKYEEIWSQIKHLIRLRNINLDDFDKKFMK